MSPDAALELSIEQLIATLNKKLFAECTRVQSAMPPTSRALVATSTAEEFTATGESSSSGTPHVLRHLRLRYRSKTDRLLDPRLSVLAQLHQFKSQELGVDIDRVEAIDTSVSRTRRSHISKTIHDPLALLAL